MERTTVTIFACVVAVVVLLSAYFTANRPAYMDEFLFFNPPYMVAHYGQVTFPVHGYDKLPVIAHPPIHTGVIGLLCRLGLTWYYAEGTPTAFWLLLAIWIAVRGAFPTPVKLGLLFGIGYSMSAQNLPVAWFGTRPEGELQAAWFAALLLLESGRLKDWNRGYLFGGAILLTWAASVHYYAAPAVAGLAVYAVWALSSLGWKGAKPQLIALLGGALLVGLPYVALYIVPNWQRIAEVIRFSQGGAAGSPIGQHLDLYRQWASWSGFPLILRKALGLGIPLMVLSTALLATVPSTRGIAMASLPLQLGVFFFAAHKQPFYLIHELVLFPAALAVGALAAIYWLARRLRHPAWAGSAAMSMAGALLCLYLVMGLASAGAPPISARAQIHPGDLARAACKQILGPHARVVGRPGSWYSAGGEIWHEHFHDLISQESSNFDPPLYLANFDAAADYAHFSGNDGSNTEHKTLSYWYSTGLLKLRGFYLAREGGDVSLVLMSVNRAPKIVGYAALGGALYRFDESASGNYDATTATCPGLPELEPGRFQAANPRAAMAVLDLPRSNPRPPAVIVTVLAARDSAAAGLLRNSCTEIGRVPGTVSPADAEALVAALRREDTPIRFCSNVEDLPGFQGAGIPADARPPTGTVPLHGIVDLRELGPGRTSRIDRVPTIRVTTHSAPGNSAASLPIHAAGRIAFPLWIRVRLRVLSGRVGVAAFTKDGAIVSSAGTLLPSPEPVEIALKLPHPAPADDLVFTNGKPGVSQVEILDVTAESAPPDALEYSRLLETGGISRVLGVPSDLQAPSDTLRLDSVLKLEEVQPGYRTARIERLPQIRLTTPDSPGGFGAAFPVHFADKITTAVWVELRLKVLNGKIGLALYSSRNGVIVRSSRSVLPTTEPVDVALRVPDLKRGDTFVVFNESVASASQVEILDISVRAPQKDATSYRGLFPPQPPDGR